MNIGLLGFGVVGRGVYEITEERSDMQVTKVLCLEDIKLPDAEAVHNIKDIVEDASSGQGEGRFFPFHRCCRRRHRLAQ